MDKGRSVKTVSFFGALLFAVVSTQPLMAQPNACGDFDGDGLVNIRDLLMELEYVITDGIPPVDFDTADFDGRQFISIGDAQSLLTCIFTCGGGEWGICAPTGAPLAPVPDPLAKLSYFNRISAGETSFDLALTMIDAPPHEAFVAPLSITINGAPALVDSITFPVPGSVFENSIGLSSIDDSGVVRFGLISISPFTPSALDVPAIIHLAVPLSATGSIIEVNWATLSPVHAPTADSSIYPIFYRFSGDDGFVPSLEGFCCLVAGDANNDGLFNISDPVLLIARIFGSGPPLLCPQSADSNSDGAVNIADATLGIAYIFSGGQAPVCGP